MKNVFSENHIFTRFNLDMMVFPHLVGVYGLLAADVGVGGELVYDDLVPGLQLTAL